MRPWIEKLAKVSKEEGTFCCRSVKVGDIFWGLDVHTFGPSPRNHLYIRTIYETGQNCSVKLYEDELDLLKEVLDYCENKTRDYLINQIENL